jgi:hypothetical protein
MANPITIGPMPDLVQEVVSVEATVVGNELLTKIAAAE